MSISMFKPSEVDRRNGLSGSAFNKCEFETIACNIIFISKQSGDQWIPFSWEDYQRLCCHEVTMRELSILFEMNKKGYLRLNDGKFSVNLRFLGVISQFLDTPESRAQKQAAKEASARRNEESQKHLQNFQIALKTHDGEITFDVLQKYAEESSYSVDYIVRNASRTDLYIEGKDSSSRIAVGTDLQTAVNKAVQVIAEQQYGW